MDFTFPHDLKIVVDHWRSTRRSIREALPTELRQAITECTSHHPVILIKKALNLDPNHFSMTSSPPVSVRPVDRHWISAKDLFRA